MKLLLLNEAGPHDWRPTQGWAGTGGRYEQTYQKRHAPELDMGRGIKQTINHADKLNQARAQMLEDWPEDLNAHSQDEALKMAKKIKWILEITAKHIGDKLLGEPTEPEPESGEQPLSRSELRNYVSGLE